LTGFSQITCQFFAHSLSRFIAFKSFADAASSLCSICILAPPHKPF